MLSKNARLAAIVVVEHDPCPRIGLLGALHAGLEQRAERVPALRAPVEVADGPEDAVADLVADRDHVDRRALAGEGLEGLTRVLLDGVRQRRQVLALPGGRRVLVLR